MLNTALSLGMCPPPLHRLCSCPILAPQTAGGEQADLVADMLRVQRAEGGNSHSSGDGSTGGSGSAAESGGVAAFERVEVLEDCYGVRRFVRAFRTGA